LRDQEKTVHKEVLPWGHEKIVHKEKPHPGESREIVHKKNFTSRAMSILLTEKSILRNQEKMTYNEKPNLAPFCLNQKKQKNSPWGTKRTLLT
jgi:hypothetical protein